MLSNFFKGNTSENHHKYLPERVAAAIREQQDASERLVGWFQLTVMCFFGLLYTVSAKTHLTYAIVPWFLAIYLLLTIARLILAYGRRMSGAVLYSSVIIDMVLLLGMIWAFHIQYQQPPSFYLKAPMLLYVFIFIALRALRFEALYVIAAGVVGAAGWTALATYAVMTSGGREMVTRDYVHYLTSNSILIGAEINKIIAILTVTAIIAVTLIRARKLLVKAVAEGTAARDLSRFFSPEIAKQITASEQEVAVGEGKLRDAAILMVDIRGFTRLASIIKPDDLVCLLAEYQSRIVPIIQHHSGTIDKFLGDGIMATYGAAVTSKSFAADALKTVDEIIAAAEIWSAELQAQNKPLLKIGVSVTTGQIIFGAVGDATRMEYTVIGDAVNIAAKLEKHTKSEGVSALCTATAYETALGQGYQPPVDREQLTDRHIEGLDKPIDIVVLAS